MIKGLIRASGSWNGVARLQNCLCAHEERGSSPPIDRDARYTAQQITGFVQLFTTRRGDPLGKDAAGNIIQEAPLPGLGEPAPESADPRLPDSVLPDLP